ncbi:MAG: helix-turn-helix transcriptional regulator [Haloferacaceae archaeon]
MRLVALSLVALVLVGLAGAPLAAGSVAVGSPADETSVDPDDTDAIGSAGSTESPSLSQPASLASDSPEPPETTFVIDLRPDRSADWTVIVTYDLDEESDRAAFDDLAADYENGNASVGPSVSLYENLAALAAERTDREMAIESVDHDASRRDGEGTLQLSFTWTAFLAEDDDELAFGDALETPEGDPWLTSLGADQELQINTPPGYSITSANVGFSDNTVRITGPHTFESSPPIRISLEGSALFRPTFLVGTAVIALGIVGAALLVRRSDDTDAPGDEGTTGTGAADTGEATTGTVDPATPGGEAAGAAEPPAEDLSLLADDERVERLLERNGGRMRQARIVSETGWSDAKVSQLLSGMAEEDRISKLRIGRENLITLPDVDALDPNPDGTDGDDDGERGGTE